MLIYDIGANIGNWSLANMNDNTQIIAIEASPITFQKLKDNVRQQNILLLNYAVCNNDCKDILFYHSYCDTLSTLNKEWLSNETSRFCGQPFIEITCRTTTIDKLIEMYGEPDLIKKVED